LPSSVSATFTFGKTILENASEEGSRAAISKIELHLYPTVASFIKWESKEYQ